MASLPPGRREEVTAEFLVCLPLLPSFLSPTLCSKMNCYHCHETKASKFLMFFIPFSQDHHSPSLTGHVSSSHSLHMVLILQTLSIYKILIFSPLLLPNSWNFLIALLEFTVTSFVVLFSFVLLEVFLSYYFWFWRIDDFSKLLSLEILNNIHR